MLSGNSLSNKIYNDPIYWLFNPEIPQYCHKCGFNCIPLQFKKVRNLCQYCLNGNKELAHQEHKLAVELTDWLGNKRRALGFPRRSNGSHSFLPAHSP